MRPTHPSTTCVLLAILAGACRKAREEIPSHAPVSTHQAPDDVPFGTSQVLRGTLDLYPSHPTLRLSDSCGLADNEPRYAYIVEDTMLGFVLQESTRHYWDRGSRQVPKFHVTFRGRIAEGRGARTIAIDRVESLRIARDCSPTLSSYPYLAFDVADAGLYNVETPGGVVQMHAR